MSLRDIFLNIHKFCWKYYKFTFHLFYICTFSTNSVLFLTHIENEKSTGNVGVGWEEYKTVIRTAAMGHCKLRDCLYILIITYQSQAPILP